MTAVLAYLQDMGGYMLLALPVWLTVRTLFLLSRHERPRWGRELGMAVFALYCAGLFSQTLLPAGLVWPAPRAALEAALRRWHTGQGINLLPLETVRRFWRYGSQQQLLVNLAGNVAVFVPLGLLPPALWRGLRRLWKTALLCCVCSCLIEFFQLFIGRSVDVDDVILNTLGGALGYLLFALLWALFSRRKARS